MPGSTMGKSVLLYDAGQANSAQNGSNTVLDMDLMQKQKMQQRLIVNEEVIDSFVVVVDYFILHYLSIENKAKLYKRTSQRNADCRVDNR